MTYFPNYELDSTKKPETALEAVELSLAKYKELLKILRSKTNMPKGYIDFTNKYWYEYEIYEDTCACCYFRNKETDMRSHYCLCENYTCPLLKNDKCCNGLWHELNDQIINCPEKMKEIIIIIKQIIRFMQSVIRKVKIDETKMKTDKNESTNR